MADMLVDIVAIEQKLWSGNATLVTAQTTEGEIGILAGHEPVFGRLADNGIVKIETSDKQRIVAAVQGGFLSVTTDTVSVLAKTAELATSIDQQAAEKVLASPDTDPEAKAKAQQQLLAVQYQTK